LTQHGFQVTSHDILTGHDFFETTAAEIQDFDLIMGNPPFSKKNDILKKLFQHGKHFLLLVPLNILESEPRLEMFRKHGISFWLPPKSQVLIYLH